MTEAHEHRIPYFVNGEKQDSPTEASTVRIILDRAAFTPPESYTLSVDRTKQVFTNADSVVMIENGEHFTATFTGITAAS